jgi:RimJ/RimL family protein N-acetyltransferase
MEKRDFPEQLATERLLLRRYAAEEAAGILQLARSDRDQLLREFAQVASLREMEQAESFIAEKGEQWKVGKTYCYGIWQLGEKEQIGQIQVKNIAWEIPSAELSYFIGSKWQRQGYATESVSAVLRMVFGEMGFERVFVRILPVNRESFGLAKKMGFEEEGVQRRAFRCGFGALHDVQYLSMTAEEYQMRVERKWERKSRGS